MPLDTEHAYIIDRIIAERKRRGWSRYRLWKETGISQSGLLKLERGDHPPTLDTLTKICRALDLEIDLNRKVVSQTT